MKVDIVSPASSLKGTLFPPGDKSISHRAVILASISDKKVKITNFLFAEDPLSTVNAFKKMRVPIETDASNVLIVDGVGINGLKAPGTPLDLGNSGTTMRLLMGLLSGQDFDSVLMGDHSLSNRPMGRVIIPLRLMGAEIVGTGDKMTAPIRIMGRKLKGITFDEKIGSAQVKSALLLAGLFAEGKTIVVEHKKSRDHTERMLELFNAPFTVDGNKLIVERADKLEGKDIVIPSDPSSAAFFIVAASIIPGSEIVMRNVGLNESRIAFIDVLKDMGADISIEEYSGNYEPSGDIFVKYSELRHADILPDSIPYLIDELPILMIAMASADGISKISGASELRVKETDRIKAMAKGLLKIGVDVEELSDGIVITGVGSGNRFKGGVEIESYFDHRIAMSFSVAALNSDKPLSILNSDSVSISYPGFFDILKGISK